MASTKVLARLPKELLRDVAESLLLLSVVHVSLRLICLGFLRGLMPSASALMVDSLCMVAAYSRAAARFSSCSFLMLSVLRAFCEDADDSLAVISAISSPKKELNDAMKGDEDDTKEDEDLGWGGFRPNLAGPLLVRVEASCFLPLFAPPVPAVMARVRMPFALGGKIKSTKAEGCLFWS